MTQDDGSRDDGEIHGEHHEHRRSTDSSQQVHLVTLAEDAAGRRAIVETGRFAKLVAWASGAKAIAVIVAGVFCAGTWGSLIVSRWLHRVDLGAAMAAHMTTEHTPQEKRAEAQARTLSDLCTYNRWQARTVTAVAKKLGALDTGPAPDPCPPTAP